MFKTIIMTLTLVTSIATLIKVYNIKFSEKVTGIAEEDLITTHQDAHEQQSNNMMSNDPLETHTDRSDYLSKENILKSIPKNMPEEKAVDFNEKSPLSHKKDANDVDSPDKKDDYMN